MKRFALLLASVAFVTPALAADVIYEEPPAPAPVVEVAQYNWSGFYVGAQAGVAFNRDSGAFSSDSAFAGGNEDGETGFIGGGPGILAAAGERVVVNGVRGRGGIAVRGGAVGVLASGRFGRGVGGGYCPAGTCQEKGSRYRACCQVCRHLSHAASPTPACTCPANIDVVVQLWHLKGRASCRSRESQP